MTYPRTRLELSVSRHQTLHANLKNKRKRQTSKVEGEMSFFFLVVGKSCPAVPTNQDVSCGGLEGAAFCQPLQLAGFMLNSIRAG